jgi:hypothetical protein
MRTLPVLIACATALGAASPAFAQERVTGTYAVKYEEMASNCSPPPVALGKGKLTIEVRKSSLEVNADLIPLMYGVPQKNGQINAKTLKAKSTTVQGLAAKYRVAGRVENGQLTLVLVAEYIRESNGKPYCTQSWNVTGARQ